MGLNDLTLEKLISEINGYKEKMRTIHEDYGRASQDLQDRINVLGYTLNDHLKETKDQIANTPQRLLNLETKYVTGEVNESEYRAQREEFKGLLQRNLKSIEDIRQMIDVLSHIETKPLAPAEFKQNYPAIAPKPLTADVWTKTIPDKPSVFVPATNSSLQSPPISTPMIPTAPTLPQRIVADIGGQASPSPQIQPQTNGTSFPNPETNNAPATVTPEAPVQAWTPSSFTVPTVSADIGPVFDESTANADAAEDVADALVVKVVDDVPAIETSSTMVSPDVSQVQTAIPTTETVPSVPASPDLSKTELTLPSQFYKVVCPKCGADVPKPAKVWELKGGKSKKNVLIGLFQCQDCRVKFREALTREIL
ncbi:MAG TPA: CdvA-like protein [Candidatus Bathyarchaeia archaeon]|nr:CdvA-like protein [Candidatus Bathyarchaeia archaeon]